LKTREPAFIIFGVLWDLSWKFSF